MSDAISTYMTADHRHCDHYLANFEQAVDRGEWDAAGTSGQDLRESLLRHFAREEEKLFPDLLARRSAGPGAGPGHDHGAPPDARPAR